MKIVVSGVPCSGKTFFGDWLRDRHGFVHLNLEDEDLYVQQVLARTLHQGLPCWLAGASRSAVVTWGYPPNADCFRVIRRFADAGFVPWWFDADPAVARSCYLARDGEAATKQFFDPQVQRIAGAKAQIDNLYGAHRIESLTSNGHVESSVLYEAIKGE